MKIETHLGPFSRCLRILLPFSFGFFLTCIFRTIGTVMAPMQVSDLHLTTRDLSLISSPYFIAFALSQIPLGLVIDRFGPRIIQFYLFIFAGFASVFLGIISNVWLLSLGRLLIGFGMSSGLIGGLIAIRRWYDKSRLPLINSILITIGNLGAIVATTPAHLLMEQIGWRSTSIGLGIITLLTGIATFFIYPEKYSANQKISPKAYFNSMGTIVSNKTFWQVTLFAGIVLGVYMGYQTLWTDRWLFNLGISPLYASIYVLLTVIAMTVGSIASGLLSRLMKSVPLLMGLACSLFILNQALLSFRELTDSYILWTTWGFWGAFALLAYAIIAQSFPVELAGRATTAFNFLMFLLIFFVQYGVGILLNYWPHKTNTISNTAFQTASWICISLQVVALIWYMCKKRTTDEPA